MNNRFFWLSIFGVILAFAGGFLIANSLNRAEMDAIRGENERLKAGSAPAEGKPNPEASLSPEEIKQRIAEADRNPTNIPYQRDLGTALYRYAAMKEDAALLSESIRLVTRAYESNPNDREVLITLGNANFDIGYFKKENPGLEKAREFYKKALALKPGDPDVLVDLGLTYALVSPPDYESAITEYKEALKADPKHERTLQMITDALIKLNRPQEAQKYFTTLKESNPSNPMVPEFTKVLGQSPATSLPKQ